MYAWTCTHMCTHVQIHTWCTVHDCMVCWVCMYVLMYVCMNARIPRNTSTSHHRLTCTQELQRFLIKILSIYICSHMHACMRKFHVTWVYHITGQRAPRKDCTYSLSKYCLYVFTCMHAKIPCNTSVSHHRTTCTSQRLHIFFIKILSICVHMHACKNSM